MLIDHVLRQVSTGAIVAAVFARGVVFLWIAEAAVSCAFFYELFGIFFVKIHALALNVWAAVSAVAWTFVGNDAGELKRAPDEVDSIGDVACAVGIFDAQDEVSLLCFGVEIPIEGGAEIADVHIACRARCKSCADVVCSQE